MRAARSQVLANTDSLTELPNRYALESRLLELPPTGSLTFIDLDGLKHYNDKHGHERGDKLLHAFASQLTLLLGDFATAFRLGGDEFAVISDKGESEEVERSIELATNALTLEGFAMAGASFGSVQARECTSSVQLKRIADNRMYQHKSQRRALEPGST